MADLSNITGDETAFYNAQAAQSPTPSGATPGFADTFAADVRDSQYRTGYFAQQAAQHDFIQQSLDAFKARYGEALPNPMNNVTDPTAQAKAFAYVRQRFADKAAEAPTIPDGAGVINPPLQFPSDDEIAAGGVALGRKAQSAAADLAAQVRGPASFAGGAAEGLAAGMGDPLNAAAVAAAPEGGLALRALYMAGAFGAAEAAKQALTYDYQRAVDPNHTIGDAAGDVASAALMGGGLEVGGALASRLLGSVWRRFVNRQPDAAAAAPLAAHDAGVVAERQADLDANNPFRTGQTGEAAHNEAVAAIDQQIVKGEPPSLPDSAQAESEARTGDVFAAEPPGKPAQEPPPAAVSEDSTASRFFGAGQSVKVKYELAELGDLVTSHDADFRLNPDYPAELQPRNRGGKPAQEQVFDIANNLEPERLGPSVEANSGAPIVGPDNVVESGNGRAMALALAYGRDGAPSYRQFLERSGYDTGGFQRPVLVARRVTPMDAGERERFAQAANGSASLRMTPAEQAMSDARHLTADVTALAKRGEVASAANRDFVRAFAAKLPQGERGGMMAADGSLSAAGVNRLRAAMVARAYGDAAVVARMFEHVDSNIKTIAHALSASAADWMKMRDAVTRGEIPAGQDITDALMQATRSIMRARDMGRPVSEVLTQGDLFASDTSQLAARLFFKDEAMARFLSKADMADNLQTFAHELVTGAARGPDMFGAPPPSALDVLKGTIAATDRRIASLVDAAKSSEAIKAARDASQVDEAMAAKLDRNIEQGRNRFVEEDAEGNAKVGVADAELHDIENQDQLARDMHACAFPPAQAAE